MNNKKTSCRQPANDARYVNAVETRCIVSLQTQSQTASVQTQDFASHLINKTTSLASGMSSPARPYYLIYYMKGANKGLRLDVVCTSVATEVVSFNIRSKIRYAGAGLNDARHVNPVETRFIASSQSQSQSQLRCDVGTDTNYPLEECNKDTIAGDPAGQNSSCVGDDYYY